MAKITIAPRIDAINPAGCPPLYQPTARPSQPATTDPAMPNNIVTMTPPGSRPGMMSLANTPTIRPTTIIQSKCICFTSFDHRMGTGYQYELQMICQIGDREGIEDVLPLIPYQTRSIVDTR